MRNQPLSFVVFLRIRGERSKSLPCERVQPMAGARSHSVALAALAAIFPLISLLAAAQEKKEFRYTVGPKAIISTTNNYGSITVKPSGSDEVVVTTVSELEIMMPSFKGRMRLDDDEAVWTFEAGAISGATAIPTGRSLPEMIPNAMPSFKDTVRRSNDEVVSTFEASAISGATASPTGRSRQDTAQKRTYWHLSDLGRKPTDYDIATSRLHYWTARGFEVKVPVSEWYERYQRGSELRCRDWEEWGDPRQTTYTTYTTMQRTREAFVNGLLDSISDDYDRGLSPQWVALLNRVLAPLRYPGHGLQMVAAYVGNMAPTARITIAATFQAADEMRRVQRLAYLSLIHI